MKQISIKQLGIGLLLVMGLIIAFAPVDQMASSHPASKELLSEITSKTHFVSSDELGHWIIDKDPSFLVVDVRSSEDYNQYHIPGSIHVPVASLSDPAVQSDLDVDQALILASNGNTIASQAWLLLRSEGYEDVFILDGGLNRWVSIYSNPQLPAGEYTDDEVFKYQFRKAAGSNLMGVQAVEQNTEADAKKKKSPVRKFRKKTKKSSDDGC